ncbi:hypothetical protein [Bacillus sp. SKDU12]|uniref:hypothetical protein n=1 Tax=Bacillus sp. SKDU12 TaxID=1337053 RepID=UPI001389756D|nr:hypothetical protein BTW01_12015 [Bacillus sp. SKDU12]
MTQEEVHTIKKKLNTNTKEYKKLWVKHVSALEKGDVLEAKQLEYRYYYLQSIVANQLDRERLKHLIN